MLKPTISKNISKVTAKPCADIDLNLQVSGNSNTKKGGLHTSISCTSEGALVMNGLPERGIELPNLTIYYIYKPGHKLQPHAMHETLVVILRNIWESLTNGTPLPAYVIGVSSTVQDYLLRLLRLYHFEVQKRERLLDTSVQNAVWDLTEIRWVLSISSSEVLEMLTHGHSAIEPGKGLFVNKHPVSFTMGKL